MRIGLTGGIGSGKSYVARLLGERGISVYDCDSAAKRLISSSADIRRRLTELIGSQAYVGNTLNKAAVAQFLLQSSDHAEAINRIVHPAVFSDFMSSGMQWVESAILFESGLYRLTDLTVAVTAPEEVRIARVMQRDGISRQKTLQWMERQMPQDELARRADHVIVNDGRASLQMQIDRLLELLPTSPANDSATDR